MVNGWYCEQREGTSDLRSSWRLQSRYWRHQQLSDVGGIERKAATTTKPDTGISVIVGFDAAGKQHRVLSSVTQVVNFYFDGRLDDRKTQVASQLYMQFFF